MIGCVNCESSFCYFFYQTKRNKKKKREEGDDRAELTKSYNKVWLSITFKRIESDFDLDYREWNGGYPLFIKMYIGRINC